MQLKYSVGQICTDQVVDGFAGVFGVVFRTLLGQGTVTTPQVLVSIRHPVSLILQ